MSASDSSKRNLIFCEQVENLVDKHQKTLIQGFSMKRDFITHNS